MSVTANLPSPSAPLVDINTGQISQVWFQFLLQLFSRTGSNVGIDTKALQAIVNAALASIADLYGRTSAGDPVADMSALTGLAYMVEAMAAQSSATKQTDERGETGDGAQLAQLSMRIAEVEARLEALGAPAPVPAGFDTTTINSTSRLIAYY